MLVEEHNMSLAPDTSHPKVVRLVPDLLDPFPFYVACPNCQSVSALIGGHPVHSEDTRTVPVRCGDDHPFEITLDRYMGGQAAEGTEWTSVVLSVWAPDATRPNQQMPVSCPLACGSEVDWAGQPVYMSGEGTYITTPMRCVDGHTFTVTIYGDEITDGAVLVEVSSDDEDQGGQAGREPYPLPEYVELPEPWRTLPGATTPPGTAVVPAVLHGEIVPRYQPYDWIDRLGIELPPVEMLPGGFLARGEQASLYGDAKVGKSLLVLDWAYHVAAGLSWLGDPAREPLRVVYIDLENSERVFLSRMLALGFEPCPNLVYLSFPSIPALDTPAGGQAIELLIRELQPDLVVIDTISRLIAGKENDADTWIQAYNQSMKQLKAAGVAVLRIDHTGKDAERGSRGSSAKTQDVDHVWGVSAVGGQLLLERTHTRTGEGPDRRWVRREAERAPDGSWVSTRHLPGEEPRTSAGGSDVATLVKLLDELGVPDDAGRVVAGKALKEADVKVGNTALADALKIRQQRAPIPTQGLLSGPAQ